jgi:plastocyanin
MLAYDLPPVTAHIARAPTSIGIGAREFSLAVYRPRVKPGKVKFNVRNLGEDVHDFVVRRAGRRVGGLQTVIKPGASATLRLTLTRPGTYQLVCTIADHQARGMHARLRVVR